MAAEAHQAQQQSMPGAFTTTSYRPPPSAHVHAGQFESSQYIQPETHETVSSGLGGPSMLPPPALMSYRTSPAPRQPQMAADAASNMFDQLVQFTVGMHLNSWAVVTRLRADESAQLISPPSPGVGAASSGATRPRFRGDTTASEAADTADTDAGARRCFLIAELGHRLDPHARVFRFRGRSVACAPFHAVPPPYGMTWACSIPILYLVFFASLVLIYRSEWKYPTYMPLPA